MSKPIYVLQKDYTSPTCTIYKGVEKTISEWIKIFPEMRGENFSLKTDWFLPKKEEKPKEWVVKEIESYGGERRLLINGLYRIFVDGVGFTLEELLKREDTNIISVLRLTDGEVFTIQKENCCAGETYSHPPYPNKPIKKFFFYNDNLMCQFDEGHGSNDGCVSINSIQKSKEQPVDTGKPIFYEMYPSPTKEDTETPEFNGVWNAIKGWDIQRQKGLGYSSASGSDVMHILEGIKNCRPIDTDAFVWEEDLVKHFIQTEILAPGDTLDVQDRMDKYRFGSVMYKRVREKKFVWTDELVLMAMDLAHHNGWHKFSQRVVELFDEIKKQASGSGYKYSDWINKHLSSKSTPKEQPKEDKIEVHFFGTAPINDNGHIFIGHVFTTKDGIKKEKYDAIKKAIEEVLNEKEVATPPGKIKITDIQFNRTGSNGNHLFVTNKPLPEKACKWIELLIRSYLQTIN